jgi:hypothetical protein
MESRGKQKAESGPTCSFGNLFPPPPPLLSLHARTLPAVGGRWGDGPYLGFS